MMDIKNNPVLQVSNCVKNICDPLFSKTPINFLHYFKTYKDLSTITLTSNSTWLEHFLKEEYFKYSSFCGDPKQYTRGFRLTNTFTRSQPIVKEAAEGYGIGPGIVLVEPSDEDSCEFYLFCVNTACHNSYEFFLNYIETLKKFIFHFKDNARHLIKQSEKNKLFLTTTSTIAPPDEFVKDPYSAITFKPLRYYISSKVYLTQKEVTCIHWIARGKNCEEIALLLNNSPRTIEKHIVSAKEKLGVYKISSLIFRAKELNII